MKDNNDDIRSEALSFISSLCIEFIHLYQIHLSCATTAIEEVLQTIAELGLLYSKEVISYQYAEIGHSI